VISRKGCGVMVIKSLVHGGGGETCYQSKDWDVTQKTLPSERQPKGGVCSLGENKTDTVGRTGVTCRKSQEKKGRRQAFKKSKSKKKKKGEGLMTGEGAVKKSVKTIAPSKKQKNRVGEKRDSA